MATVAVGAVIAVLAALAVRSMVRDRKKGKSISCGGNCSCCSGGCRAAAGRKAGKE